MDTPTEQAGCAVCRPLPTREFAVGSSGQSVDDMRRGFVLKARAVAAAAVRVELSKMRLASMTETTTPNHLFAGSQLAAVANELEQIARALERSAT